MQVRINMRVKDEILQLDYENTKNFFNARSTKYDEKNPYTTTMYQDNNPQLVEERDKLERKKIIPLLQIDTKTKVLDIACGVGRWADAIKGETEIEGYRGVDFSDELIKIARERNDNKNFEFDVASTKELVDCINKNKWGKFNLIIMAGILIYLNEEEIGQLFRDLPLLCEERCIIYLREPIGTEHRLTLKEFYSEELQSDYNAIYRTKEELLQYLECSLLAEGFSIKETGALFEEDLNNRKETQQYYFILER